MRQLKLFLLLLIVNLSFGAVGFYTIPSIPAEHGGFAAIDMSKYRTSFYTPCKFESVNNLDIVYRNDSLFVKPLPEAKGYYPLEFRVGNNVHTLMIKISKTELIEFKYPDRKGVKAVHLMGNFNDWSRTGLPCKKGRDGNWQIEKFLKPGKWEYKFVVDRAEILDPFNPDSLPNGLGGFNSILKIGADDRLKPGEFRKENYSVSPNSTQVYYKYYPGIPFENIRPEDLRILLNNDVLPKGSWELAENDLILNLENPWRDGLLRIFAVNNYGDIIQENHLIIKDGVPLNTKNHPGDWHFSVLYSIMVDRFLDGNPGNTVKNDDPELHPLTNFYGGDIAGIQKKIEEGYFSHLGITSLWISPLIQNPDGPYVEYIPPQRKFTGYHGYWPVHPRNVDARFGTAQELKNLTRTAHENHLKVLLDFVSNHTHENHPYFTDHRDWYGKLEMEDGSQNLRNFSGETMLTTWFDTFLPSFDFSNAGAIQAVTDDAVNWMEEYNFDGFRQDATKHVPHAFWKALTRKLRSNFPEKDLFQIGESFGSDELIGSYVNPGELDSQFNFSIYFSGRWQFAGNNPNFVEFNDVIRRNLDFFGPVNLMGTITSSHDQVRFMGFADGQVAFDENGTERAFTDPPQVVKNASSYSKLFMFTAVNVSLPGVPVVYYGEEIGQIGAADPGNRRPMRFDGELTADERKFRDKMSSLLKLRQQYPALSIGDFTVLYEDDKSAVWLKQYFEEKILILFNNSDRYKTLEIPVGDQFSFTQGQSLLDLGMIIPVGNKLSVTLNPYETKMYTVK